MLCDLREGKWTKRDRLVDRLTLLLLFINENYSSLTKTSVSVELVSQCTVKIAISDCVRDKS